MNPSRVNAKLETGVYLTEKQKVYDTVKLSVWNTDHITDSDVQLSELWYSSADNDLYALRADGVKTNYVQGDYPVCKIELYYCPPDVEKPKTLREARERCELVAVLDEPNAHYDVSGKMWNVSAAYLYRGRVTEV